MAEDLTEVKVKMATLEERVRAHDGHHERHYETRDKVNRLEPKVNQIEKSTESLLSDRQSMLKRAAVIVLVFLLGAAGVALKIPFKIG